MNRITQSKWNKAKVAVLSTKLHIKLTKNAPSTQKLAIDSMDDKSGEGIETKNETSEAPEATGQNTLYLESTVQSEKFPKIFKVASIKQKKTLNADGTASPNRNRHMQFLDLTEPMKNKIS